MLDLAVCIETVFAERPFLDRINAVAEAGLPAYEFWLWPGHDIEAMAERQARNGLRAANFNVSPLLYLLEDPDMAAAEQAVRDACRVAHRLGCPRITLHGDSVEWGPGRPWYAVLENEPARAQYLRRRDTLIRSLVALAPIAADEGLVLLLEPLNTTVDHRGYFLGSADQAIEVIQAVAHPALKLLFDIYHMQIAQGNVTERLVRNIDLIGHIHLADVPGRHEPGTGELNYANILRAVRCAGYGGDIGLELFPKRDSLSALRACIAVREAALADAG